MLWPQHAFGDGERPAFQRFRLGGAAQFPERRGEVAEPDEGLGMLCPPHAFGDVERAAVQRFRLGGVERQGEVAELG